MSLCSSFGPLHVTMKMLTALNNIVCSLCGFYNSMSSFEEKQHLHLRFKFVYSAFSTHGFITASDQKPSAHRGFPRGW